MSARSAVWFAGDLVERLDVGPSETHRAVHRNRLPADSDAPGESGSPRTTRSAASGSTTCRRRHRTRWVPKRPSPRRYSRAGAPSRVAPAPSTEEVEVIGAHRVEQGPVTGDDDRLRHRHPLGRSAPGRARRPSASAGRPAHRSGPVPARAAPRTRRGSRTTPRSASPHESCPHRSNRLLSRLVSADPIVDCAVYVDGRRDPPFLHLRTGPGARPRHRQGFRVVGVHSPTTNR